MVCNFGVSRESSEVKGSETSFIYTRAGENLDFPELGIQVARIRNIIVYSFEAMYWRSDKNMITSSTIVHRYRSLSTSYRVMRPKPRKLNTDTSPHSLPLSNFTHPPSFSLASSSRPSSIVTHHPIPNPPSPSHHLISNLSF